jgi:hypothetical protein
MIDPLQYAGKRQRLATMVPSKMAPTSPWRMSSFWAKLITSRKVVNSH